MQLHTHIDVAASPQRLWSVLTDFRRFPEWNPFIRSIQGSLRKGAKLDVRLGPPGGDIMAFKPMVTRVEPGRVLAWLGVLAAPWLFRGEHVFRLEPLEGGHTRMHQSETFGGLLLPLLRRRLEVDTRRGFEAMNKALKARVEGEPVPSALMP
ncbi:MAG TPA: SRPBCC domain-containing protein [Rhodanobacteraceae bacterium]